jgi:hypothetical protein
LIGNAAPGAKLTGRNMELKKIGVTAHADSPKRLAAPALARNSSLV